MDGKRQIEEAIGQALAYAELVGHPPPRLAAAMRYALFPGGARVRPKLCLATAIACGAQDLNAAEGAAASIELLHCASLIHDDMPCFDDAPIRRGKPSVHRAYGEPLALLTGDALIVLAFQNLAFRTVSAPRRLQKLTMIVGKAVGMPSGIVAGQAWECEPNADLEEYQQAKTGALFAGATMAGAVAADAKPEDWRRLGEIIGHAYQVADDIRDVAADPVKLGKPVGQDEALDRPSVVREIGLDAAIEMLEDMVERAIGSIPDCPGADSLKQLILEQSRRFLPEELAHRAA